MTSEVGRHLDQDVYDLVEVRKPADYPVAYAGFLAVTDEKARIAEALKPLVLPGTLVDIGAGSGEIIDDLELDPANYTAIEQRAEFAAILREKGLDVIEELFPVSLPQTFNNVLMSYVLYGRDQCDVMIDPAWDLVSEDGQLLVVTYRDNNDDYSKILHRVGHTRRVNTDVRFDFLEERLAALGTLYIEHVRSHIFSEELQGLATALGFLASNTPVGTVEDRLRIRDNIIQEDDYLREHYLDENGTFAFPIDHYIFRVVKEGS